MTYLVAILLPDELSQITERIQQQFQSPKWHIALPPHVTFLYTEAENEKKFIESIDTVCKKTAPVSVAIHGLGQFTRRDVCIYATVEKTPEIVNLYVQLNHQTASPDRLFTPHVTLSNRMPKTEAPAVYAALKRKGIVGYFFATECHLYRRNTRQKAWEKVKTIPFSLDNTTQNRLK